MNKTSEQEKIYDWRLRRKNSRFSQIIERLNLQAIGAHIKSGSDLRQVDQASFDERERVATQEVEETLCDKLDQNTVAELLPVIEKYACTGYDINFFRHQSSCKNSPIAHHKFRKRLLKHGTSLTSVEKAENMAYNKKNNGSQKEDIMVEKKFLMGNEAIGLGAIRAGVNFVSGYPGTPSTEILETIAKNTTGDIYVEWSVNEKAALEAAAGASYAGARTLVTMKQVGLNVASDPLMSLAYVGIKGGMVIAVADDPGPISSQTEQDTRHFARFSKLPVFDPCSPEEAYVMIGDAFEYSEKYHTPVLFRPTTRVCHGCAAVNVDSERLFHKPEGFIKDSKWVIFPRLSYQNHIQIEQRYPILSEDFSSYGFNLISGTGTKGVATGGISYEYTKEALGSTDMKLFKVATPHPFPERLALDFLSGLEEVLVIEELDPVIERELIYLCGKYHLNVTVKGKLSGDIQPAGENTVESVKQALNLFAGIPVPQTDCPALPPMPIRPPVLCAGCPHRASFYAVKQAMKGVKAVFSGDIGCYTLGNASPLEMVDTCLCMGAGVTVAQGLHRIEPDAVHFSFIGDSTFFASGITGIVNAVYNETNIVLIVLDNSTTAMTGHQPHPGTGKTMMGNITDKISIPAILTAIGVKSVQTVDPLNLDESIQAVKHAAEGNGVSAVIFKSPCIAVTKPESAYMVDTETCIGCKKCISQLGCPAIVLDQGKALIEPALCYGCSLCAQVCPVNAIGGRS